MLDILNFTYVAQLDKNRCSAGKWIELEAQEINLSENYKFKSSNPEMVTEGIGGSEITSECEQRVWFRKESWRTATFEKEGKKDRKRNQEKDWKWTIRLEKELRVWGSQDWGRTFQGLMQEMKQPRPLWTLFIRLLADNQRGKWGGETGNRLDSELWEDDETWKVRGRDPVKWRKNFQVVMKV